MVFPDGPYDLRQGSLNGLGYAAWSTGRYRAAAALYRQEAELCASNGDRFGEATARFNQALIAEALATTQENSPGEAVYREAIAAAQRAENHKIEARTRLLLARELEGEESLAELRRALEIGREIEIPNIVDQCLRLIGAREALSSEDPEPGLAQIRESIRIAHELADHDADVRGRLELAMTLWQLGREDDAIAVWYEALDIVEDLRGRQGADEESARVASRFAFGYYQLAGRLLERNAAHGDSQSLESALAVIERLRVDSLRSATEASGARASALPTGEIAVPSMAELRVPDEYSVIHLATHSVIDTDEPERSALVLAGDSGGDDGRLTIPEIAELELAETLVVLATCRSAAGVVLHGKGVLGPTRAFLMAGARAVLGTLWPVEDRQIQRLVEGFYERLARGEAVAESLAEAQRAAIADGVSPSVWAGVVVVGDGSLAFLPAETKLPVWMPVALGLLPVGGFWWWRRQRRSG